LLAVEAPDLYEWMFYGNNHAMGVFNDFSAVLSRPPHFEPIRFAYLEHSLPSMA
jgi:hypothetical protein